MIYYYIVALYGYAVFAYIELPLIRRQQLQVVFFLIGTVKIIFLKLIEDIFYYFKIKFFDILLIAIFGC
jgi:hypothetical protein